MRVNADFSQRVVIKPRDYHWVKSPSGGVDRIMLDRIGSEQARATSFVKYSPNSNFPEHTHIWGEEIFVLTGVFTENKTNHFPTGWYLRNPHKSVHQPSSKEGALIFVKLMQMREDDIEKIHINTHDPNHWININGQLRCSLYKSEIEETYLIKYSTEEKISFESKDGLEFLIIDGELQHHDKLFPQGTWARLPDGDVMDLVVLRPSTLYIKTGHLSDAEKIWKDK